PMQEGDYAKYKVTGTVGKVLEVQERDGVEWAMLDTYELWYVTSLLEPALAAEYKRNSFKERTRTMSLEDMEALTKEVMADISTLTPSGGG
ncbi:MAG: DUF2098 domain-containing protein, partial [Methanomassiliicoccales archaeon]|nr:DUF2098 domain-containing protein [Methanomassiliicoccales archaeon]